MVIVRPIKTNTLMSSFNAGRVARVVRAQALPSQPERHGPRDGGGKRGKMGEKKRLRGESQGRSRACRPGLSGCRGGKLASCWPRE